MTYKVLPPLPLSLWSQLLLLHSLHFLSVAGPEKPQASFHSWPLHLSPPISGMHCRYWLPCSPTSSRSLFFFFWQGEGFLIALCKCVTECKFGCPMYGEVKQIETSEFGAERGLLQGQSRRMGGLCSKIPNSLKSFSKAFLKRRWGRGIPGFITSPCTSLWLVDDDQSLGSRSLGARCSWPLSKNFFHFLQKNSGICIRYYLGGASLVAQW